jgi:putative Holliday junction resolvase
MRSNAPRESVEIFVDAEDNDRLNPTLQVRDDVRPVLGVRCTVMCKADAVCDPGQPRAQLLGDFASRSNDRDRLENLVLYQTGHIIPTIGLRQAVELEMEIAPTMTIEGWTIGGRRTVEGEMLACGDSHPFEIFLGVRRHDHRRKDQVEVTPITSGLLEPALDRRHDILQQRPSTVEGMAKETVCHFAGDLRHQRSESGGINRWRTKGVRSWIEGRNHQGVLIELAAKIELGLPFPTSEDGFQRQHDLAHPSRRTRPRLTESLPDMWPDLRAQAEDEAPGADRLQSVGEIRKIHRVASKRDRNRRPEPKMLSRFRAQHQRQKRVVFRFEAERAVVTDLFESPKGGAGSARVLQWGSGIDQHDQIIDGLRARPQRPTRSRKQVATLIFVRILGVDLGSKRIGLAISDEAGAIAFPAGILESRGRKRDIASLARLIVEKNVGRAVVGLPIHMDGRRGPEAEQASKFADALHDASGIPVDTIDERWTSREAERLLQPVPQKRGTKRRKPNRLGPEQRKKGVVDEMAASIILRTYLAQQGNESPVHALDERDGS